MLSIIVPFRGDGGARDRNWDWCRRRWESLWPDAELVVSDCDGPFARGRALNDGVRRSSGDLLLLADADGADDPGVIEAALGLVKSGNWVIAYSAVDGYQSLTEDATRRLLARSPEVPLNLRPEDVQQRCHSYSGAICLSRYAYWSIGGFDPRFQGFGYEDNAFQHALDTLWGHHVRVEGAHLHLHHPHVESDRFEQPFISDNRALSDRYAAADGDRAAMAALVAEHRGT